MQQIMYIFESRATYIISICMCVYINLSQLKMQITFTFMLHCGYVESRQFVQSSRHFVCLVVLKCKFDYFV